MFGAPKTKKPAMPDHYINALGLEGDSQADKEWPARIEALAVEAEATALQDAPAKLAVYRADHKKDGASYKFDCRRHGDFLAVFMERGGRKEATTINLGRVSQFRMDEGRTPDNDGVLTYRVQAERLPDADSKVYPFVECDRFGRVKAPRDGCKYAVSPKYEHSKSYGMIDHGDTVSGAYFTGRTEPHVAHRTPNYPRPAEDDRITFGDIGVTILVPAGKGGAVLARIHAEVAKT